MTSNSSNPPDTDTIIELTSTPNPHSSTTPTVNFPNAATLPTHKSTPSTPRTEPYCLPAYLITADSFPPEPKWSPRPKSPSTTERDRSALAWGAGMVGETRYIFMNRYGDLQEMHTPAPTEAPVVEDPRPVDILLDDIATLRKRWLRGEGGLRTEGGRWATYRGRVKRGSRGKWKGKGVDVEVVKMVQKLKGAKVE